MIEWISGWLKNIIIIVLLATFVDLLLPNSSMQKYAKMVLGLLIILAIISPILSIFSEDLSLNNLFLEIEEQIFSKEAALSTEQLKKDTTAGFESYQQQMLKQVEKEMLLELKQLVENRYDVTIKNLSLEAHLVNSSFEIARMNVYISEEKEQASEPTRSVETVKPVNIKLNEQHSTNQEAEEAIDNQLIKNIKEIVKKEWGFKEEMVIIRYDINN